jgi:hypothetical protein
MLMELVLDDACGSNDPHVRLAELLDQISTRTRNGLIRNKLSVMMQFRGHAEAYFIMAAKNV